MQQHFCHLTDIIDVSDGLLEQLIADDVLSWREAALIRGRKISVDQNYTLLVLLSKKSPFDFEKFVSALQMTNQEHVADILRVKTSK